ncbi:hypothetical protein EJ063_07290 [Vibrio aquaticus]|uniref:Uncharacterized protein n=1 Tax=Vibrio aquaticus TaxID=2496559 RepID=A0A3S0PPC4_9VIBR|nr:hypothetical protein [Vibrio aquaticus]RTZ16593.1 hypothetical protein EJ063_07290 [Vibrio aquaticus]
MNRHSFSGLITSLACLMACIYLLASDTHFPVIQWPYEAFQGLVFSLVWGFGVSATVGYVYATLITVTLVTISFAIGHKISRITSKTNNQ